MRCATISLSLLLLAACGPRANIPPTPLSLEGSVPPADSAAMLARALAPVLYLHPDETFPLVKVVAVLHPERPVIAYHLLWRDDAHGAWIPFTRPTDQEIVWVGYGSTGAPTDVWTYWHGSILHADWRGRGQVKVNVQWGKHGSIPRITEGLELPFFQQLQFFYALSLVLMPEIWLGTFERPGPAGFFGSYRRYTEFTRAEWIGDQIDLIVRAADPGPALEAVFGVDYSRKRAWPRWGPGGRE